MIGTELTNTAACRECAFRNRCDGTSGPTSRDRPPTGPSAGRRPALRAALRPDLGPARVPRITGPGRPVRGLVAEAITRVVCAGMAGVESPQMIATRRAVNAESVLAGTADLRGYPYRHIAILSQRQPAVAVTEVMASAEILSHWGWELLNVANVGHNSAIICGVLRRRG